MQDSKVIAEQVTFWSRTGITRQVIVLAAPLILQNLSQTLLGVADTYFVSLVSTEALAAVGLASIMFFAAMMFFRGTTNSTIVFVGRAFGANQYEKIGVAVWNSLNAMVWLTLLATGLPWILRELFVLVAPPDNPLVGELGAQYLAIRAWEIPFMMFSTVVWGFLVGRGDSRTPMILAWITVLLNIALDWILVLGHLGFPALGVAGAAYATLLSNAINAFLSGCILWRKQNRQQYETGKFRIASWSEVRTVFRIGLPMGLGDFVEIASFSAFFGLLAQIGTEVVAANQIAIQYMSVAFTLGMAINMATSSLVSQELGAERPERAKLVGYRASLLAMAGMGVIGLGYLIAPEVLIGVFSQDPLVIGAGVVVLRLIAFYQFFDGLGIVLSGALNGAGDTTFTMWTRTLLAWGMFIPLVWLLIFPLGGGVREAWIGALTYLGSLSIIYFFRFRSGRWQHIQLN